MHKSLHETDFHAWCFDQVSLLTSKQIEKLDWENLIEEVRSMGGSERQELENRLTVLFIHLLKWKYQKDFRSRSWELSIKEQRKRVKRKLEECPSLKSYLDKAVEEAYSYAIIKAQQETGLPEKTFPEQMPFELEKALNEPWMPE